MYSKDNNINQYNSKRASKNFQENLHYVNQGKITMDKKEELINDIQNLLNSYGDLHKTFINADLLKFMDEKTLLDIIGSLLDQKEDTKESDLEWLEKFKKYN